MWQHFIQRKGGGNDPFGRRLLATEALPRHEDVVGRDGWQPAHHEGVHAGRQGDLEVDLRQAEEAAVDSHDPEVVSHREHRPGREGVAVTGRHRGIGRREDSGEDQLDLGRKPGEVLDAGSEPFEIEAVRVELAGACRHQSPWVWCGVELVEGAVDGVDPCTIHAVLAVVHAKQQDSFPTFECDHDALPGGHATLAVGRRHEVDKSVFWV